jgi:hypothetical protein
VDTLQVLFFTLVTAVTYMVAGRLVFVHLNRRDAATPFNTLMAGMGIWYVWFLLMNGVVGASLTVAWYTFLISNLALLPVLTKALKFEGQTMFFWPKVVVALLLLSPALWALVGDSPTLWAEFTTTLKNADHLFRLEGLALAEDIQNHDIFMAATPAAFSIVTLPVSVMFGQFVPGSFAVMNLVVLTTIAGQMIALSGIYMRWANVALTTVCGLFGLTLLNPFFMGNPLPFSANGDFLTAAALFAAAAPLTLSRTLPRGALVIPNALVLCLLVGTRDVGFYLYALLVAFWILRAMFEDRLMNVRDLFGWSVLSMLPMVTWLIWGNYTAQNGLVPTPVGLGLGLSPFQMPSAMAALASTLVSHPWATAFVGGVALFGLRGLLGLKVGGLRRALTMDGALSLSTLLLVAYVGGVGTCLATTLQTKGVPADYSYWVLLSHLQFVILLPAFVWCARSYVNSDVFKLWLHKASGWAGVVLSGLFFALVVARGAEVRFATPAAVDHTLRAASAMRSEGLRWGERVAVLDLPETKGFYSAVMGYGLRHDHPVRPVTDLFYEALGDAVMFHDALRKAKFDYLWVHAPNLDMQETLGDDLKPDHSYFFQITSDGFKLRGAYPHKAYSIPAPPPAF